MRRRNQYLTPDITAADTASSCRLFRLPLELVPYLSGALANLTEPWRWEAFGTMTPETAAELFASILSEVEDNCPIMDVRQSILDPCVLEKTFDGVTWEPFANTLLCAAAPMVSDTFRTGHLRANPTTGAPEWSVDGTTWTPVPEDTFDGPQVPPLAPTPGTDDEARKCLAATRAALSLSEFYKQTFAAVAAGVHNTLLDLNMFLHDLNNFLFQLVYSPHDGVLEALEFFEVDFGEHWSASGLTEDDVEALTCLLLANATAEADGTVTFNWTDTFNSVIEALGVNPGTAVSIMLSYLGGPGLNQAGTVHNAEDGNCSCDECDNPGSLVSNYYNSWPGLIDGFYWNFGDVKHSNYLGNFPPSGLYWSVGLLIDLGQVRTVDYVDVEQYNNGIAAAVAIHLDDGTGWQPGQRGTAYGSAAVGQNWSTPRIQPAEPVETRYLRILVDATHWDINQGRSVYVKSINVHWLC